MDICFDKKVMIISNSITGGGAEISMMRLFHTLTMKKVDVEVCAINEDNLTETSINGVKVLGREWGLGFLGSLKSLLLFRKHLLEVNPDILIVNCELPELYVTLVAPIGKRIITVEHTSRPWNGRRILGRFVRFGLKLRKSSWVTVSRDQKLIWPLSCKPLYIPNSHVQSNHATETNEVDIVFVGRLNVNKHPEVVAEAALRTKSVAAFYGDGPDMLKLKEEYQGSTLHFFGFIDNPWSQISTNSIVVVASEYEGDGMNIVEAVSNNNPILLANNPDLKRFDFPEKNYFSTVDELVNKICNAKKEGADYFRIPSLIRSQLLEERDPIRIAGIWVNVFEEGEKV
jgi:glycosyltransferase involved in cell wall biosynthesis